MTPGQEIRLNTEDTLFRIKSKECMYFNSWIPATHVFSTRKVALKISSDFLG